MQLYETVNGEVKVRLLRDHQPNQAMLNEFQTAQFDCKMTKMELCGSRLHGYEVDDPACFLKVFLSLRNVTSDEIFIYKEDFQLSYDKKKFSFEAEDEFGVTGQFPNVEKSKPESFSPESPCMVKGDRNGTAENGLGVARSRDCFRPRRVRPLQR